MASWEDVRRLAVGLPETTEELSRGHRHWRVRGKGFVWERPLRRGEIEALGDAAPDGPILGARVEHVGAKQALLEEDPEVYFTTAHFENFAAILVRLERISTQELEEVVTEAWLVRAPTALARTFLHARS